MEISVIVPVYNTGKLLNETLNSILSQTFRDFEILLVDDGSNKETALICDTYSAIDSRVKTFHKKNGGICEARNYGLERSAGKYITFCDHDDIYESDKLEKEIRAIKKCNADAVVSGKENISDDGSVKLGLNFCYRKKEIIDHFFELNNNEIFNTIWNIMYKRELIAENRFDTTFTRGHEDINFNLDVLLRANVLCGISDCLYHHIKHDNTSTSAKLYRELIPKLVYINNKICSILADTDLTKDEQYIYTQGEKIKSALIYAIKCKVTLEEYKKIFGELNYINVNINVMKCINNPTMAFYCIRKYKLMHLSYFAIKWHELLKR